MAYDKRQGSIGERVVRAISSPIVSGIAAFNRWRLPPRDAPHPLHRAVLADTSTSLRGDHALFRTAF